MRKEMQYLEDFLTSGSAENESEYIRKREAKFQKHNPSKSQIPWVTAEEIDQPPQTDEPIPTRHEEDNAVQQRIKGSMKGVNQNLEPALNSATSRFWMSTSSLPDGTPSQAPPFA
ncbi:unnamed protein product [Musa acuminata var. zebrina]